MLTLLCLAFLPALAQDFRATISGHVFDSSGGAVPNVKIQITNVDNNEVTTATSDNAGAYSIPLLRPGSYKLSATTAGFKQFIRDNITLEAAKVLGVDITLEVGAVTDTVEVTAAAAVLDTQSASRGGIVTTQQVSELPLNARNPFMLGSMMSGVTFNGAAIWQRPFDNGAIAEWSINGSRNSSAEFTMDGASNNGQMGGHNIAYVPVVDAVQEFNVMTNMYNAEYGHTGGGVMNVVLKAGGNQHHLTAWEFMRRTPLDANTFQRNATNLPNRATHYLDQYGFLLEGPLRIPKLLKKDGPVKLFYMGTYEGYREGTPNPLFVSYPEPEMRTGDFSKVKNSSGLPVIIYNPFDSVMDAAGNAQRKPFPGNIIPSNMINPIAKALTTYMPLPNRAAPAGQRYANQNLALPDYFDVDKFYNLILKFDANIGNKNRAYFRHASNDRTEDRAGNGIDNKPGTDGQQPFQRINDAYVADWTITATPTVVVDIRGSFNRFIEKGFGRANEGFDMTKLGISSSLLAQLPSPVYFGRWNFDNGYNSLGRSQSNNFSNTYQLQGSVTKVSGAHTLKFGADTRQINYLLQNTGDILLYEGKTTWTQSSNTLINRDGSVEGDGYASFLLGIIQGSSNYPLFPWWKQPYTAFFAHDDWKVSRKLTLNLGIRYDLLSFTHEKWNRQNGPFDPNVKSGIVVPTDALNALRTNGVPEDQITNLANLKGSLTFAGVGGIPSTPATTKKSNFAPRMGFAYQVNERLVIRGGGGLYISDFNNDNFRTSGFSTSTPITNSNDSGRNPIPNVLSNPYPTGISLPTGSSAGTLTFAGKNDSWFDSNAQNPKAWTYSMGFQYQTTKASTLEVTYVGTYSYDQTNQRDYNIPNVSFANKCNLMTGGTPNYCNQTVPNPFRGLAPFLNTGDYTATTISRGRLSRLFPQFNGNLTQLGRNDSLMRYDSVQINYNLRVRGGLMMLANYTLSKQIETWGFNDPYNYVQGKGLYYLDRPHVLKVTPVWQLPFGRGKKFGTNSGRFMNAFISGWSWNATFTDPLKGFPSDLPNAIQLKDPRTPVKDSSGNFVKDAQGNALWNGETDWKAYRPRLWNPCVLRQNDDGTIVATDPSKALGCGDPSSGNYAWLAPAGLGGGLPGIRYTPSRSGQIRRHHAFYLDSSILKDTRINERIHFQLGFEAFNVFNHNYFGRDQASQDMTVANFGSILPSTVSTQNILPRQIQVRFKFFW